MYNMCTTALLQSENVKPLLIHLIFSLATPTPFFCPASYCLKFLKNVYLKAGRYIKKICIKWLKTAKGWGLRP